MKAFETFAEKEIKNTWALTGGGDCGDCDPGEPSRGGDVDNERD